MKTSARKMFEHILLNPDGWFLCVITHIRNVQTRSGDLRLEIPAEIAPTASGEVPLSLYFLCVNGVAPLDFYPDGRQAWFIKTNLGSWRVFENECPNPVVSSRSDTLNFLYKRLKSHFGKHDAVNIVQMVDVNLSVYGILP